MVELDSEELRRRLAGAGVTGVAALPGAPPASPSGGARRPTGGDQGCPARCRTGRASRRAASGPHHQSACRDAGSGSRGAVGGRGGPAAHAAAVRDVACRRRLCGAAFRRLCRRSPICPAATATRAASWPRCTGLSPIELGLGGEPVVDPVAEVQRWSDTLRTVDAALVPGWPRRAGRVVAAARQPRWAPAWCTVTSGWAT